MNWVNQKPAPTHLSVLNSFGSPPWQNLNRITVALQPVAFAQRLWPTTFALVVKTAFYLIYQFLPLFTARSLYVMHSLYIGNFQNFLDLIITLTNFPNCLEPFDMAD